MNGNITTISNLAFIQNAESGADPDRQNEQVLGDLPDSQQAHTTGAQAESSIAERARIEADYSSEELHLLRPDDVDRLCAQEHQENSCRLVAGFIARRRVVVLIGDSGVGKSPLAYQLGLCVAAGIPFLGMPTEPGLVVYADYENGLRESRDLRDRLCRFLGLPKPPENFLLWTPDCGDSLKIEAVCQKAKPALLIVDSLRSHNPYFEKSDYAPAEMNRLRASAYKNGVATAIIHHTKKPGPDGTPPLDSEATVLMHWLNLAAGHRSLINQSDTRIAADLPDRRAHPDAAMILRWHTRIEGEAGPLYLERVFDEGGEPIGYERIIGPKLLENAEQEAALKQLPKLFTFKEAKRIYRRADDPTRKWLLKCQAVGLIRQTGKGSYVRLEEW